MGPGGPNLAGRTNREGRESQKMGWDWGKKEMRVGGKLGKHPEVWKEERGKGILTPGMVLKNQVEGGKTTKKKKFSTEARGRLFEAKKKSSVVKNSVEWKKSADEKRKGQSWDCVGRRD